MNQEFLKHLFKEDAPFVHVTDFIYDPNNIPSDRHLSAWKGDWFSRYRMSAGTNQYFTISIFNPDDQGVARRRKALFLRTRVIVLDDVREKLSMEAVKRLPEPSWILETSPGSEQWGYILDQPCSDRGRVENLLDGLVANGLAPDGKDPGMKGVTRYVRLPDGCNNKASKLVDGKPFQCHLKEWHPERTTTMEALASPFHVNLDAVRREARVDGAADIPDHPLLQIPDIIHIKEVRSDGRFDITCPWVDEHTGNDDSGTAIFTNDDGSIGFKCHHGGCSDRTAKNLISFVESQSAGFGSILSGWRVQRVFADLGNPEPSFIQEKPAAPAEASPAPTMEDLLDALKRERHTSSEARTIAQKILRLQEELPTIERQHWHNEVCDLMHWSKQDFKIILKDLRSEWYSATSDNTAFLKDIIFVKEQNRFYDNSTRIFYTPEAFQNSFAHEDVEARKTALQDNVIDKVDRMDFAPRQPRVFTKNGIVYGNAWCASKTPKGIQGDCSRWLDHWDALGWGEHRDHHLKYMAYTMKRPEVKINHMLLLGGMEGTGKDFLIYPLIMGMGEYSTTIDGNELLEGFNDYLLSTKHLHINETELGDHRHAREVSNKLKPLAAAPPNTLRVNQKNIIPIKVSNIVNSTMTTNSPLPIQLNGPSRRFYACWTNLNVRDEHYNMIPEWLAYWNDRWSWMNEGGYHHCIHYILNEVDISNFNPGEAPPMTDFLRDITEASKSPAQQTVESFIRGRVGAFGADIITASDAMNTLKAASITHADLLQVDAGWFTVTKLGRLFGDISTCAQVSCRLEDRSIRMWIIRNAQEYLTKTPSKLLKIYDEQIKACKDPQKLTIVK